MTGGLGSGLLADYLATLYPLETALRGTLLLPIALAALLGIAQVVGWIRLRPPTSTA
jgi:hypothetical protein